MATKIKRRYTDNRKVEFKIYSDMFDKTVMESNVLNRDSIPSISTIFWDRQNIKDEIELFKTEHIPARQAALANVYDSFASYQAGRKKEGRTVTDEYPPHLLKKRVEAEARLDVAKRELEFLEERLEKYYNQPEAELEEKDVLSHGPIGRGVLRNGSLSILDGQRIEPFVLPDKDEILVIASKSSPYYGMSVADYRTYIIVPWVKERRMRQYNLEKQRTKELAETGFSKIVIPPSGRKIHQSSLPPWPEGVKNYYAVNEEVNEGVEDEKETSNLV
jgi:hypothetical protein